MGLLPTLLLLVTVAALIYLLTAKPTPRAVLTFLVAAGGFVWSIAPVVLGRYGDVPPMLVVAALLVGVPLLLGLAVVFKPRPAWLACALIVAMPLRVPVPGGSQSVFLLVPLYLIVLAGFLSVADASGEAIPLWRRDDLRLPLAALVAVAGISLVYTAGPVTGVIRFLCFWVAFALLYHVETVVLADERARVLSIDALIVSGAILSVIGIAQRIAGSLIYNPKLAQGYFAATSLRVNSLFWDPNMFGRFLVVLLLVCGAVLLSKPARSRVWLAGIAAVTALPALLFTYSRSSFIALGVGTVMLAWRLLGRGKALLVGVAMVLVVVMLFSVIDTPAFNLPAKPDVRIYWGRLLGGRLELVQAGMAMFAAHPIGGVGVGGFPAAFARFRPPGYKSKVVESHTSLVTLAAELGALGFALFVWLAVRYLGVARRAMGPASADPTMGVAASCALAAIFVHSIFYGALFEDPFTWFFAAMSVVLAGRRRSPEPAVDFEDDDDSRAEGPVETG